MNNPKFIISVIIPTFNQADQISEVIQNALNQSYSPHEVIIVDDGSSDNTKEVISKYSQDKVRYIFQDNSGPGKARNTGIKSATGNWIAFLDSDDKWASNKLEMQINSLSQYPKAKFCFSNYSLLQNYSPKTNQKFGLEIEDKLPIGSIFSGDYLSAWQNNYQALTSTVIAEKDTLVEAGLFAENIRASEDVDLWARIGFLQVQSIFINEPLTTYTMNQPHGLQRPANINEHILQIKRLLALADQKGLTEKFRPCLISMIFNFANVMHKQKKNADIFKLIILPELKYNRSEYEKMLRYMSPKILDSIFRFYHNTKRVFKHTPSK